ncbi:MAG: Non-canonical purine NTP pyrophosphatase [Candidatus Amesbacteria bacterium GW2011_GWA2_42_12]|uniref:dITP/XTP pyrophosphatase n=1 Tax=Candidatus Amesbacteria bacterium GW2011_GWA2_42_12 TaxID=1618356 RepID=A0A0G0Y355_9BACT|nr:MAG: Non-canonical purine NTP pyrophosphatase [Candidatus Amesbacteria bacterium GW2011_GWA2_42_12]
MIVPGMTQLLVATHNKGKIKEIQSILADVGCTVLSLDEVPQKVLEPEETGTTYEENALIKAKAAGDATTMLTMADDSGLEVDALPGQLGVYSARYGTSDADRITKLLTAMQGKTNRTAAFVSCVVLYDPKTQIHQTFMGKIEGTLTTEKRGEGGFGYDPLFIPNGYTKTFAQLGSEEKNMLSHRARALQKLKKALKESNK